jgi:lipoprotein NlpD
MRRIQILILLISLGCATTQSYPPITYHLPKEKQIKGIYHKVNKGDTLYSISKAYGVNLDTIMEVNHITNPKYIKENQFLFIPGVKKEINLKKVSEKFIWPLKGKVISYFGEKLHNIKNKGIDIRAIKDKKVVASRSGKVCFVGEKIKGYGKVIIIDHGNNSFTLYAYNNKILVRENDWVNQGDLIAIAGTTGRAKFPTLHFEIRKGHLPQDPLKYLTR